MIESIIHYREILEQFGLLMMLVFGLLVILLVMVAVIKAIIYMVTNPLLCDDDSVSQENQK